MYEGRKEIHRESIPMSKDNTVFQAETVAIYHACDYLAANEKLKKKYVIFFCDSQACLKALNIITKR